MKGSYRIIISNTKLRYDFTIKRNITVLKGDSATGKTTLIEMINEYYEAGSDSGISLRCDCACRVLRGRDWKLLLTSIHESIVFIDEENAFLPTREFAEAVRDSDNYYVLVSREGLPNLPYSVEEIYGIRQSGKYVGLKQVYNEFYHIYGQNDFINPISPECILVEDSNSGFEFFQGLSEGKKYSVVSAKGKSNIFARMSEYEDTNLLIIADGAAFGSEMDRVMKQLKRYKNSFLFLPESFEWLILKSGVVDGENLKALLQTPENYIESRLYFSWERFFTVKLVEWTSNTYLKYSKRKLNPVYLHENLMARIKAVIEMIDL